MNPAPHINFHTSRIHTIQRSFERELRDFLSHEAVEILARVMAHVVHRDIRQFPALTEQFKKSFAAEHNYLNSQTTSGGPDAYHRSSQKFNYGE